MNPTHAISTTSFTIIIFFSNTHYSCLTSILLAGDDKNRGILVIIKNYTGDRLNFGLAVEMAKNLHNFSNIKMLVVDDDCSIDNVSTSTGRRGLAGVCFIHKIAGAMSSMGSSLDEIHAFCSGILERREIRTIGFVFDHDFTSNKLKNIEIGYGIHGEPGSMKLECETNFNSILNIMDEKLWLKLMKGKDLAILINNLGGASQYVFNHFMHELVTYIDRMEGIRVRKIYAGMFLTSMKREGFSVSLIELNDPKLIEFLKMPVESPHGYLFNTCFDLSTPRVIESPISLTVNFAAVTSGDDESIEVTRNVILNSISSVKAVKDELNRMDCELGDGDTGTTISRAVTLLEREINNGNVILSNPRQMLTQISEILMDGMGGTSGAIFSIFFQCSARAFERNPNHHHHGSSSIEDWSKAITFGIEGIMKHGKSNVGDRTLLDALQAGLDTINSNRQFHLSPRDFVKVFAEGCFTGVEATKRMRPKCGRAVYSISDRDAGFEFTSSNPDPGAYAVYVIAKSIAETLNK